MGGTAVVHACPFLLENKYRISGVAVLDVVEGAFLPSLPSHHSHFQRLSNGSPPTHAQASRLEARRIRLARGRNRMAVRAHVQPDTHPISFP